MTATAAPTTAERIRSACARGGGGMLAVEGVEPVASPVHHLLDDGSFAITVPGDGLLSGMIVAAGTSGVQAVLEMTDYAPLIGGPFSGAFGDVASRGHVVIRVSRSAERASKASATSKGLRTPASRSGSCSSSHATSGASDQSRRRTRDSKTSVTRRRNTAGSR